MTLLTDLAYLLASVFYLPVLLYQAIVQRKNRRGWGERFGRISLPSRSGTRVWVHAVSLGEVNAARLIVEGLRQAIEPPLSPPSPDGGGSEAVGAMEPTSFTLPPRLTTANLRHGESLVTRSRSVSSLEGGKLEAGEARPTGQYKAAGEARPAGLAEGDVVISTTTDTGYAQACGLYGGERVFRFPLDFSWVIRRAFDRVRPSMIVLVELEVWPNLVRLADRRGIPVVVVNGRLTERSCRRLSRLGALARGMFRRLTWVGAQDAAIADRFKRVGVLPERVEVTGSVKWDTVPSGDTVAGADRLATALELSSERPLWVCGSTGPREEEIILDAYGRLLQRFPGLQLAVIPRKPERFEEVAGLMVKRGYSCVRRSDWLDGSGSPSVQNTHRLQTGATAQHGLETRATQEVSVPHPDAGVPAYGMGHPARVVLGDTMGELRKFYSLADVVFVGRSMVPMGGSDPMEVAALGKPMVVGPYMDNFAEPVAVLTRNQAIQIVRSGEELGDAIAELLNNSTKARDMGEQGRQAVKTQQGATERTLKSLLGIVECGSRHA